MIKIFDKQRDPSAIKFLFVTLEVCLSLIIYYLLLKPMLPDWRIIDLAESILNALGALILLSRRLRQLSAEHIFGFLLNLNVYIHLIICVILCSVCWIFKSAIYCFALPNCDGKND
jgi:hypothetical protein